jgi:4-hydroxy-tetrahydrodipicolinate synthase
MKNTNFGGILPTGSIVALVTPFDAYNNVDYKKLGHLIEWHIKQGSDGIVVLGTTGESPTLSEKEKEQIVSFAAEKADNRIFLIAGSGSNDTAHAVSLSKKYENLCDALLVITPYYNKTNTQGMIKHFSTVADAVTKPIIMYNVPGRTGCNIDFEAAAQLKQHKNICSIKEASGNISYSAKIATLLDDNFCMYSGNDDIVVPMLSIGAIGVISVWANLTPKACSNLVHLYLKGERKEALQIQLKYLNLINLLFKETNPIPVKAALNYLGVDVGQCRLPLYEISDAAAKPLFEEIDRLKIEVKL